MPGLISPKSKPDSNQPPFAQVTHPESGTIRDLYDCLAVPLTPQGPVVRLLVATHPAGDHKPAGGVVRKETVYELFYTTVYATLIEVHPHIWGTGLACCKKQR